MKHVIALLCVLLIPLASFAAEPGAPVAPAVNDTTAEEAALLLAWEKAQAADPKTRIFERTSPRTYRFKTERFPYDGSLKVANVVINQMPGGEITSGSVEVTLDQTNSQLREQYPMSFPLWAQNNNSLMRDAATGRWMPVTEWIQSRQKRLADMPWWQQREVTGLLTLIMLGMALLAAVVAAVRYQLMITRKLREEEALRHKLLADAGSIASRDTRMLQELEHHRQLLADAMSRTGQSKQWRPRWRSKRATDAAPVIVGFTPNPIQLDRLKFYWKLRQHDDARPFLYSQKMPTRVWGASAVILICLAGLLLLNAMKAFSYAMGMLSGVLLMILMTRESFAQLWPGLRQVLDWRKVEALVKEEPPSK